MMHEGREVWSRVLEIARWARSELQKVAGVRVMGKEVLQGASSGLFNLDETKIVIDVRDLRMTGIELLDELNRRGVKLELAGPTYGLAILTVGTERSDVEQLVKGVQEIVRGRSVCAVSSKEQVFFIQPEKVMLPRASFWAAQDFVALEEAAGRVCAEIVTPYPPGIPMLMPGERISSLIVDRLLSLRTSGFPTSASDPSLTRILVVGSTSRADDLAHEGMNEAARENQP
jgi:arginine/lysine/ornithine decarboxylase